MTSRTSGKVLTRPTKKVLEEFGAGTLEIYPTLVKAEKELTAIYDAAGKKKSSLRTCKDFNTQVERYEAILTYAESRIETTALEDGLQGMYARIHGDSREMDRREGLGKLVSGINEKPIKPPSQKSLRKSYPSSATISGCYEILEGLVGFITPENRGNRYGTFLGVYEMLEKLIEDVEKGEEIILRQEHSKALELFKAAEDAFYGNISLEEQIKHNGLCTLRVDD